MQIRGLRYHSISTKRSKKKKKRGKKTQKVVFVGEVVHILEASWSKMFYSHLGKWFGNFLKSET